nr:uncharacterized protein LOC129263206 [Lytechinus pictus]
MVQLTIEQRVFLVTQYQETRSFVEVQEPFRVQFPERQPPTKGPSGTIILTSGYKSYHADDENSDGVTPLYPDVNPDPSPQEPEEDEDEENEDWKIIEYSESDKDETIVDIDGYGGSPSNSELCTVVRPVANVTLALELAKALRLDVNDIIVLIAPRDPALMERLAWQLLHQWCRRLGRQEKEEKLSTLLQGYNIEDAQTGIGEICAEIRTTPDLNNLSERLDMPATEILQVMASSSTFEPALIRRVVLKMLQRWVKQGGTRLRLLEMVQAFHFNDAAERIAKGDSILIDVTFYLNDAIFSFNNQM